MNRIPVWSVISVLILFASLSFAASVDFPDLKSTEFFINSIPEGVACYVVSESQKTKSPPGQNKEFFKEEYFKGKTPLKITAEPGNYYVIFSIDRNTMPAELIFGREALPTVVSWGGQDTPHGSHYLMFSVSKEKTAGTFIGLAFDASLSAEQVNSLYPKGNNFTITDEARLRNQLGSRRLSSADIETAIQRLYRGGKAAVPTEAGGIARLVIELKPGGAWNILANK